MTGLLLYVTEYGADEPLIKVLSPAGAAVPAVGSIVTLSPPIRPLTRYKVVSVEHAYGPDPPIIYLWVERQ